MKNVFPSFVALVGLLGAVRADVALAPLFRDGAVLQRDKPVTVWGTSAADETVKVEFKGSVRSVKTTQADGQGRWAVKLDPMAASSEPAWLIVTGRNMVTVSDILVGDVWLCSGQSNMEMFVNDPGFAVFRVKNAVEEARAANFPLIREFKVGKQVAATPKDTVVRVAAKEGPWAKIGSLRQPSLPAAGSWVECSPETVVAFSAVGYFFARELHRQLGVPIGIINSTWGGTPIEAWMSQGALASNECGAAVTARWQAQMASFPANQVAFNAYLREKEKADAGDKAAREFIKTHPPLAAPHAPGSAWTPSGLFNGMINPLVPFAVRGILWYQGESNASQPAEYAGLFPALITSWRASFGQGNLPFYWVQLAGFRRGDGTPDHWPRLREAQAGALRLPETGQALAIDLGDPKLLHPLNKQDVGRRLALIAEARIYHLPVDYVGPVFDHADRENGRMRVHFQPLPAGFNTDVVPGVFEVAGADRKFHPAAAHFEGDTIVVQSTDVAVPIAVRYAWQNYPEGTQIYSAAGLPMAPFRTDSW